MTSPDIPPQAVTAVPSPNVPRPDDELVREMADVLRRIENNYYAETSGPGSCFEGQLLEDAQAAVVVRRVRAAERERCAQLAEKVGAWYAEPHPVLFGRDSLVRHPFAGLLREQP